MAGVAGPRDRRDLERTMSKIVNEAKISEDKINLARACIEHRATWMALTYAEMEVSGVDRDNIYAEFHYCPPIGTVANTMKQNRDYLVELDQRNGDGDLGITMADGNGAIAAWLAESAEQDLGKALMKCSMLFNEKAPSTLGTITSLCLMAIAKSLRGKVDATLVELAAALKAASGDSCAAAFAAAAEAARAGSEATKAMKSVHGRAAYYGDKSIGIIDGGTEVGKLIFESIAEYCVAPFGARAGARAGAKEGNK